MRQKNAKRKHFIGVFNPSQPEQEPEAWLPIGKWIAEVTDESEETTVEEAYYDGDGTTETTVTGIKMAWAFAGTYDPEDAAQAQIASLKYKTGSERKVWQKYISSDNKQQYVGVSTVTDIKAGSGAAGDYEEFGCKIAYDSIPKASSPTG
ncbi:TPA: phage tail protein [Streptococcus suis]|nr:phage tail protein [Streptococcus suis]